MTSPAGAARTTHVHPPDLAGAAPGTVIGVVERLNSSAEIQDVFPLIAGSPHLVSLPRGERHLLRGWSPYVRLQPTVITGGGTPSVSLTPPARPSLPDTRAPGSSSGWICLWQHAEGQWSPRALANDSPMLRDWDTAPGGPSTPPVTPDVVWALQTGGANRAPACTLLPSHTEVTVKPLSAALKGPLEVRPVANSGYTLLEALRTGRMHAALAIESAWRRPLAAPRAKPSLFDLAVGYARCRRGDAPQVQQWLQGRANDLAPGEGTSDILAISAWLAHRTQSRLDSRDVIDQLAESHTLPMAAEGLRILADVIRLLAQDRHAERPTSWQWIEHCLNSSAHTALTTYTAQTPDQPTRAPARRVPPPHEGSLHFRLVPASDGARIHWQPAHVFQEQIASAAPRERDDLRTPHGPAGFTLIIRHRDAEWLWRFARELMTRTEIGPVLFRDTLTLELRFTIRDIADIRRELNAVHDHVRDGRMTLSVPSAEQDIPGGPVNQLADLLPGVRLTRDDDA